MNVFLWIVQGLLAALFAVSGFEKVSQSKEKLTPKYPWMSDFSQNRVRFIGVMELLGAIGLIVPAAIGIAPVLAPIAATGLAVLIGLGAAMHIRRNESRGVQVTVILLAFAIVAAWGRFGPYGS